MLIEIAMYGEVFARAWQNKPFDIQISQSIDILFVDIRQMKLGELIVCTEKGQLVEEWVIEIEGGESVFALLERGWVYGLEPVLCDGATHPLGCGFSKR